MDEMKDIKDFNSLREILIWIKTLKGLKSSDQMELYKNLSLSWSAYVFKEIGQTLNIDLRHLAYTSKYFLAAAAEQVLVKFMIKYPDLKYNVGYNNKEVEISLNLGTYKSEITIS